MAVFVEMKPIREANDGFHFGLRGTCARFATGRHVGQWQSSDMSEHSTKKPGVWLPAFMVNDSFHAQLHHGIALMRTKIAGAVSGMVPLRVTCTVWTPLAVPVTVWVAVASVVQVARSVEVCTV